MVAGPTVNAPPVTFAGDTLSVRFDRFDLGAYGLFLRVKRLPEYTLHFDRVAEAYTVSAPARFAPLLGVPRPKPEREDLPLSAFLYDDQEAITHLALDAKRFAYWGDCGLGKTIVGLEWSRLVAHRTGGRVLIVTLNEIVKQWIEEARDFYGETLPVVRLKTRAEMSEWCEHGTVGGVPTAAKIAVTNYEKFNHRTAADQVVNELRHLAGIVTDESSRLKTGGGKQKWALIKSAKGIEYKLSLTATPAPNETTEFASQASFLEKMRSDTDIIWTYFQRDSKTHRWAVKPHARAAFFEFMSSWSIYVRDPKRYGWRSGLPDVPPPEVIVEQVEPTDDQLLEAAAALSGGVMGQVPREFFVNRQTNAIERMKLSQIAKGFRYRLVGKKRQAHRISSRKPARVAEIVRREVAAGAQVLVWTEFDAEGDIILAELAAVGVQGVEILTGKTPEKARTAIIGRFRAGECRVLVSRAKLLGFGMNFQFCTAMVFSGWSDSYESFYQAVRRAVRHGQSERVRVYLPCVPDLEGDMLDNIVRKQGQHEAAVAEMEANYHRVFADRRAQGQEAVA